MELDKYIEEKKGQYKHIYNMLSEDIKMELDKYNQEKKGQYKPTHPRMAKVHEQGHEEAYSLKNPEPDLENHFHADSYPMQDTNIEDLLETHIMTEFCQPIQVQSHLEMSGILVQLGRIQCT